MIRRLALTLLPAALLTAAEPKRIASYQISARLDPAARAIEGRQILAWWNDSPDEIRELQFHLYMNAFRDEKSTFWHGREVPERLKDGGWGSIEVKSIRVEGGPDLTRSMRYLHPDDDNAGDRTVMAVDLPQPLKPGTTIRLAIDFRTRLPHVVARTGYHGDFYFVAQWFPKIGVWEEEGERDSTRGHWNCHQFHATTEFYADYGRYEVEITVPTGYVVGATGVEEWRREDGKGSMTLRFVEDNVHDFAWTASPRFVRIERAFDPAREIAARELAETARLLGLPEAEIRLDPLRMILLIQPEHLGQTERHFRAAANAIQYFGLWYGKYPYRTITVVDPPFGGRAAGGMEYPTLITAGTHWLVSAREPSPEGVTVHEFGHQYWYGLVANNEFEEAWLDEGINTYSTAKVMDKAFGPVPAPVRLLEIPLCAVLDVPTSGWHGLNRLEYLLSPDTDALVRNSWEYESAMSYGINAYPRPALALRTLENLLGGQTMARALRTYHQRWRYRHPTTRDFVATVNEVAGKDMTWFFDRFFFSSDVLDYAVDSVRSRDAPDQRKRTTVTIRRRGGVVMPVDIRFRFEDGGVENRQWDGRYRWARFEFVRADRIESVEIDPGHKMLLDTNLANNSYRAKTSLKLAAKWSQSLLLWAQQLLLAAGSLM